MHPILDVLIYSWHFFQVLDALQDIGQGLITLITVSLPSLAASAASAGLAHIQEEKFMASQAFIAQQYHYFEQTLQTATKICLDWSTSVSKSLIVANSLTWANSRGIEFISRMMGKN